MRLLWTLLSTVWTTLPIRRYQFASGFTSWTRLYYQRTSHFTTSTSMDSNQSKRPRKELNISPFEAKIGKDITTCPKCFGD